MFDPATLADFLCRHPSALALPLGAVAVWLSVLGRRRLGRMTDEIDALSHAIDRAEYHLARNEARLRALDEEIDRLARIPEWDRSDDL